MTQNKTESIRFYYNGLRVNGERTLTRCCYTLDNRHDGAECVTIYAKGYDDLPRDIFPVENDSDSYTDYFEHDRATLFPDHPLYKFARYAAMKANTRGNAESIERVSKEIAGMGREPWAGYIDARKANVARWQRELADFNAAEDPGQPTAADVEACHALRLAEENARREKEHEEELRRREKALNERNNGRRFIEQTAAEHPIEEEQPVVRIHWSEHPAFYGWKDDELVLSVAAAEIILKTFDEQRHAENEGYDKTEFSIEENGETVYGGGRYDLGDGDGGLCEHIRAFGRHLMERGQFGQGATEEDKQEGAKIVEFANRLQSYTPGGYIESVEPAPYMNDVLETLQKKREEEADNLSALIRLLPDEGIIGMASDLAKNGSPETARYVLLQLAQRDKKKAAEAARSLGL